MHRKKALVFDWDGTCTDSFVAGVRIMLNTALALGLPIGPDTIETLRRNFGMPTSFTVQALWPNADVTKFREALDGFEKDDAIPLFPGTIGVFESLRKLGVVNVLFTNRPRGTALSSVTSHGMTDYFTFLQTQGDGAKLKPSPDGLNLICDRLDEIGIKRDQVALVGDSPMSDWPCARDAGVDFIGTIQGTHARRHEFVEAGVPDGNIITNLGELLRFVE